MLFPGFISPFPYLIDFPANLLSGNKTNIASGFLMQILWISILSNFKKYGQKERKNILLWVHESKKYLKTYSLFVYTSLASELEYKTNIIIDFITTLLSLLGSIFLLSIFQNANIIGGWNFEQALIIQGIYTVLNGITNTWFNPNLTEIVKHMRGTLDFVLLNTYMMSIFHIV